VPLLLCGIIVDDVVGFVVVVPLFVIPLLIPVWKLFCCYVAVHLPLYLRDGVITLIVAAVVI
jgi:hypothetical protein